ncbi:hypothetical protein scyTo_0019595 [Scyliorhinus torazame]|uniref:Uncharacterized protein n=1 Tax=Scyliorhinus torazame TaxID=75743 RepID=A0A401Q2V8_SCYTO|nr:hypothetical protein [Scyliorhinus torazame]
MQQIARSNELIGDLMVDSIMIIKFNPKADLIFLVICISEIICVCLLLVRNAYSKLGQKCKMFTDVGFAALNSCGDHR